MNRSWTWLTWMLLAAALIPLLIVGMVAVQRRGQEDEGKGPWLIFHSQEPGGTLNPIISKDAYASSVNSYIYESFLRRDPATLKLVPNLAESMPEISEDKKVFTFRLRKGIRWHDGKELTADDVIFSFNTIMNPKVDCQNLRGYFDKIEKIEKLDDYTVRFTASDVYWKLTGVLGTFLDIIPKHVFEFSREEPEKFNINPAGLSPMGCGPYKFLKWEPGQQIVLIRNEDYWNKERMPQIRRTVFRFIKDPTTAIEHVKKEEIDVYGCSPEQWFRDATEDEILRHYRRFTVNRLGFWYIGWNQRTEFFKDRRVRLAMTHAVPRERFLETRMNGLGTVATGPFHVLQSAYDASVKPWAYDLDESRRLLDEAGWVDTDGDGIRDKGGRKFEFRFLLPSDNPMGTDLALTVQGELRKIGVQMNIQGLDWPSFIARLDTRDFDAVTLGWTGDLDPDPFQIWHSSQTAGSGSNFVYFENKEADRLIEDARREFDEKKRDEMFHRFHRILHEEQPYTFLFYRPSLRLTHRRFENVRQYPFGFEETEWWVKPQNQRYGLE